MAQILVIDDAATDRHVLGKMLHDAGHDIITANDGEEGIAKAKAARPELILMDIVMPGLNGFQATRKLRKDPETQNIPVVIITTKDQETDKEWGIRQGANGYLVKPVKKNDVLSAISQLLR